MFRKIIAALAACGLLLTPLLAEAAPPVASGGGAPTTAAQIQSAVFPNSKPAMKIACVGDSIMAYTCLLDNNSWLWWALASKPRRVSFEPFQNSEYNGSYGVYPAWNTTGSSFAVAGSGTGTSSCAANGSGLSGSMNCPNKIAAVAQYNPDILIVWVGANESTTGSATTAANIDLLVQALLANPGSRLKSVILVPTGPRTQNASQGILSLQTPLLMQNAIANRRAVMKLQATNPVYHILDLPQLQVDPTAAGYAPTGGCAQTAAGVAGAGTPGAVTVDCIHPSVFLGYIAGYGANSPVNRLFDAIGIDAIQPPMLAPGDYWDATTAPNGQLLSTETGTGAGVTASTNYGIFSVAGPTETGTGGSGTSPNGWNNGGGSSNAELLYNGSQNNVTYDQFNQKRLAYQVVFSSAATLTADRTWYKQINIPSAKLTAGATYELSVHIKIKSGCSGLTGAWLTANVADTTSGHGYILEGSGTPAVPYLAHDWAQDLIPSTADQDLDAVIPTYTINSTWSANTLIFLLNARFSQASNAPVACTIQYSDAQMHRVL